MDKFTYEVVRVPTLETPIRVPSVETISCSPNTDHNTPLGLFCSFSFPYFFVSVPCARLSWPYHIFSYITGYPQNKSCSTAECTSMMYVCMYVFYLKAYDKRYYTNQFRLGLELGLSTDTRNSYWVWSSDTMNSNRSGKRRFSVPVLSLESTTVQ